MKKDFETANNEKMENLAETLIETESVSAVESPVAEVIAEGGVPTVVPASSDLTIKYDLSTSPDFNVERERKKQKAFNIVKNIFLYIFLTFCAVLAFLPFYWMIISSLKTEQEYRLSTPTFFPQKFQWANYKSVLSDTSEDGFGQLIINTLVVGVFSTVIGVIVTILTAYAFARMNFKGKNVLFSILLGTMMIPGELYTITNYITATNMGLKNSYTVLILPFLVSVYYIYLLRNNFMQIPNSLYQAAKVDGLSDMGYLVKVMVPLTAPTLVSITLLKFIGTWNSYIWPRLINDTNWQMITNWVTGTFTDRGGLLYGGLYGSSEGLTTLKMAAACMVALPLFILFIFCRKYIMHGVSKSGTKG
ncbi:MAG: carbohydrate ABC transporter permease [Corallococcus sp.]|nr:carbohydrate ABC transporter permease [Corallococcus sp.]